MIRYTAACACGGLQVDCQGEPQAVVQCHCTDCKKRTGAPFGVGVYYSRADVDIRGASRRFVRKALSGADFIQFHCPVCASTVYWHTERHPDGIGIAFGCFEGMDLPPVRAVFEQDRCSWVEPLNVPTFIHGRDSEQVR